MANAVGDPTIFGNMDCHPKVVEAVKKALDNPKINGYGPALGLAEARQAIAQKYHQYGINYTSDDIFVTSGCSHALQMAISGVAGEGDSILLPRPGFSIYYTIADHFGICPIEYPLLPERQWEIDLIATEKLIQQHKPHAWVINNPSNPCGSVYSKQHLLDCLHLANKYRVLIISDEVYEDIVFSGVEFTRMASLAQKQTIVTCSGLAKRFMIPGWRVGWIALHDPEERGQKLRAAFFNLSCLILGPCTLIQAAVPDILQNVPPSFHHSMNKLLEDNAKVITESFSQARLGNVEVISPQGTLYMMLRLPENTDDVKWCQGLLEEQNVCLLPGSVRFIFICLYIYIYFMFRFSKCPALLASYFVLLKTY